MASLLMQLAPRVILPTYFLGEKVATMNDSEEIAQTIAFTILLIAAVNSAFSAPYWLAIIPGIAAWSYSNMMNHKEDKQVYRYTDWVLTTPIMLLALLVAVKSPLNQIIFILFCDIVMILSGYLGVTSEEKEKKFVYFAVGMIAFIPIILTLLKQKTNQSAIYLTLVVWSLYPVVWFMEEFEYVTEKNTTILYSIMDVIAKVGLVNLVHI
jgi:bacteriorhodopsin